MQVEELKNHDWYRGTGRYIGRNIEGGGSETSCIFHLYICFPFPVLYLLEI
jgi:hypothetical protein